MSRTKRQMQKLLDRYTVLQLDYEEWLRKEINFRRDVRDGEWSDKQVGKIGVTSITFKHPFKIGGKFVVSRMYYCEADKAWVLEGGILRDTDHYLRIGYDLTLKDMNALIRELDDRGYFDK